MNEKAVYTSVCTVKSLWQEYRIYNNRVEFDTHLGQMTIPFDHIERINISESEVKGLLKGDLHLKNFRPALKLDWANFLEHVVLDKSEGHIRRVLFTPDDPAAFKRALEEALTRYKENQPDS
ncbi:MAG: PH domain-containing protein [Ignavibacteriaceae bacterium]|nr:PH domain-containing protein [Ignavibacteriaceae bacterium]